jgi:serine phosphatase RsbU (regulator of sigma subunit)
MLHHILPGFRSAPRLSRRRFWLLLMLASFLSGLAQLPSKIQELEKKLLQTTDIKERIDLLSALADQHLRAKPAEARKYALIALDLASKSDNNKGKINSCNTIGNSYYLEGNYNSALEYYLRALRIVEELGDKKGIANGLMGIGNIYSAQGNDKLALEYQLKSLALREELKDKEGVSGCYNNIGIIYMNMRDYDKALDYQQKSLKIKEELGDKKSMSSNLGNIGAIYYETGKYELAMEYQQKAFAIRKELNNRKGMAMSYVDIGSIYEKLEKPNEALQSHLDGVKIAREVGYKVALKAAYLGLASVYEKLGNPKDALEYYKQYTSIKDSILNQENSAKLIEMETRFETEKKEKEIALLTKGQEIQALQARQQQFELDKQRLEAQQQRLEAEQRKKEIALKENELQSEKLLSEAKSKELKIQAAEVENHRIIRNVVTAGLLVALALALLLVIGFRQKMKANKALAQKNAEIAQAYQIIEVNRDLIAEKNKSITDSINYASRIQKAMLPWHETISKSLRDYFIFYRPKDIVSGDFYFYAEQKGRTIIAAVDCTGHGVPGAFMSMVGNDILNQVIIENSITQPGEILNQLNKGVKRALRQDALHSETQDGMDIAICSIDIRNRLVEYAGANRPLYYGKGELQKINGNKAPIGGPTRDDYPFTNHELRLNEGDMLYMFSDGYADQFGGEKGKKFMLKNFKTLLDNISNDPLASQREVVERTLINWSADREQVDDILVIGVRL